MSSPKRKKSSRQNLSSTIRMQIRWCAYQSGHCGRIDSRIYSIPARCQCCFVPRNLDECPLTLIKEKWWATDGMPLLSHTALWWVLTEGVNRLVQTKINPTRTEDIFKPEGVLFITSRMKRHNCPSIFHLSNKDDSDRSTFCTRFKNSISFGVYYASR